MNQRIAAEIFGEFFALQLGALTQKQTLEAAAEARRFLEAPARLGVPHHRGGGLPAQPPRRISAQLIASDGVGLHVDGVWSHRWRRAAPDAVAPRLARPSCDDDIRAGLGQRARWRGAALRPQAFSTAVAGVLAIPLSASAPRDYLFFFRRELVADDRMGGDPNKSYSSGPLRRPADAAPELCRLEADGGGSLAALEPVERELAESTRSALVEVRAAP